MSTYQIAKLLDRAFDAYASGTRVNVTLHGDDAVAALRAWAEARGLDTDDSDCTSAHPRGEQRWTMVSASFDDYTIATAHSTGIVTEQPATGGAS